MPLNDFHKALAGARILSASEVWSSYLLCEKAACQCFHGRSSWCSMHDPKRSLCLQRVCILCTFATQCI